MTAVTALFMIPTALVFPALLRKANTPPSSVTLTRSRWDTVSEQQDLASNEQDEEPSETKPGRGERTKCEYYIDFAAVLANVSRGLFHEQP